jgi:O-antigen/teichoic acid export membrane protein
MNKFEARSRQEQKSSMRISVLMGVIGLGFAVLALVALGLIFAAPARFWSVAIAVIALLLLIMRQTMRVLNKRTSKAAQPDPESILKLD